MKIKRIKTIEVTTFMKIAYFTFVVCVVMYAVAFFGARFRATCPYAVMAGDEALCYVENEAAAQDVLQNVAGEFAKDGTTVKLIKGSVSIRTEKANRKEVNPEEIETIEEATAGIIEDARKELQIDNFDITVVSTKTVERPYIPRPNYVKDEKGIAGTSTVKKKGVKGTREVIETFTTVDGKVQSVDKVDSRIIKEGKPATIAKGTLGLPKGEDWETYEGKPVLEDGGPLAITAKTYCGKVRYVLGGKSLKSGVDCVGFVQAIYGLYGIHLSSHLTSHGRRVSYANAKPGDIIVYAHHVGLYAGNGMMVDATSRKGISYRSVSPSRVRQVRRIIK